MPTTARSFPFIWPTWIAGLLAGDDQCRWAAWFKAHHTYDKRPDDRFDLVKWKAEHGDMVQARAAELFEAGYTNRIEAEFKLKGRTAILSGKVDLVALHPDDGLVVDCKGGKRKAKDAWQVAIYLFALPKAWPWLQQKAAPLRGEVRYRDGALLIQTDQFGQAEQGRIVDLLRLVSAAEEPARSPSVSECRFCDIACCPDRVEVEEAADTAAF